MKAVAVAGDVWLHRADGERFWSLCRPSAAKLERTAAVVLTVITVMTVVTACGGYCFGPLLWKRIALERPRLSQMASKTRTDNSTLPASTASMYSPGRPLAEANVATVCPTP